MAHKPQPGLVAAYANTFYNSESPDIVGAFLLWQFEVILKVVEMRKKNEECMTETAWIKANEKITNSKLFYKKAKRMSDKQTTKQILVISNIYPNLLT